MSRIRSVLDSWLLSLGGSSADFVDDDILDYICSVLEDFEDGSSCDVLCEVCCSIPSFERLGEEARTQAVIALLEDVAVATDDRQPSSNASASDTSLDAVLAAFKQATMQCQQQSACADITNRNHPPPASKDQQEGPDVLPLLQLCPAGVTQEFVEHIVQHRCNGDLQAAADWLLECCDVLQQQEQWQRWLQEQQAEREAAERDKQLTKKQLVERFDLQVVSSGPGKKPGFGHDLLPTNKKGKPASQVRYREGQIVSSKGEKYIVEKVGEEWDGGSKGKVCTKGKHGKGFL